MFHQSLFPKTKGRGQRESHQKTEEGWKSDDWDSEPTALIRKLSCTSDINQKTSSLHVRVILSQIEAQFVFYFVYLTSELFMLPHRTINLWSCILITFVQHCCIGTLFANINAVIEPYSNIVIEPYLRISILWLSRISILPHRTIRLPQSTPHYPRHAPLSLAQSPLTISSSSNLHYDFFTIAN